VTSFVYGTPVFPAPKTDRNAPSDITRQWAASDTGFVFGALNDLRTAILVNAVNVLQYGAIGDGVTDCTAFIQAALAATQGRTLYFPKGKYLVTSTLFITTRSHHLVGDFANRNVDGGTEISFTGTGPCFQIGTDNGHSWDANEYNGLQDQLFEDLWISHGAPDTALVSNPGGASAYKAGAYGIWDWRGGQVVLRNVGIEHFEASFVGVQSDINIFDYVVSLYSKYGLYLGPRSDQATIRNLYSFNSDRALTIDRAGKTRLVDAQLVGCGTPTSSAIEIRQGSYSVSIVRPWFEHVDGAGYQGVDQQSFVSVGEVAGYGAGGSVQSPGGAPTTSSVQGCTVSDAMIFTTLTAVAAHTRYGVTVGKAQFFELRGVAAPPGNSVGNLEAIVAVQAAQTPNATDTQIRVGGIDDSFRAKAFVNLGAGTPAFDIETSAAAGRVLGASTAAIHTINGKLTVQTPGANPAVFVNSSVSGQTATSALLQVRQNGTYDTSAGFTQSFGVQAQSISTHSGGGSSLRNVGLQATAANAEINWALETANGDVQLNTASGITKLNTSLLGVGTRAAAPSTGTHVAGEVVFNADPISGGFAGWICVTGGSPGTWKSFGVIS